MWRPAPDERWIVWRMVAFAAGLALVGRFVLPAPPPRTLDGLAAMLSRATAGTVRPADIAWEPSPGVVAEFLWGRRVLFLSGAGEGAPRDLFRARVRVTLEGRPITIAGVHNLTATPLGDEQRLVIQGQRAAFATASYGAVESVTLLDLTGQSAATASSLIDVMTSAITHWRETGTTGGIGRLDVNLETPGTEVLLAFDQNHLLIGLGGKAVFVDLATGTLGGEPALMGAHAYVPPALRKRAILWAVDTVRAEVGPAPVALVEAAVFNARDLVRRSMYSLFGPEKERAAEATLPPPPPKTVDASDSQTDPSVWPPAPLIPIFKNPESGEGHWEPVTYTWLKRFPARLPVLPDPRRTGREGEAPRPIEPPPYFYKTQVRPDPERPYAKVLIVAMDMRQLELDMEAGVEDPKPLTGLHGSGKIPRDPKILDRVVGAFNGAFKTTHGEYGMMVHRRVLLPPKPGGATLVVTEDRRVGLGTWGPSPQLPSDVVSFRQNLEPLMEDGKISPSGRTQWGWHIPGTSMLTERSGVCVTEAGQLYYIWGDEVSAATLGKAMILARCTYGMHLDMNPHHTGFVFASIRSLSNRDYDAKLLTPLMEIWPERYLEYSPKDFFYLMLRNPEPSGDVGWTEDFGTQPAPIWLPAVWRAIAQSSIASAEASVVQVELLAFDASRVSFRVQPARREGSKREYASPELGRDDSHRVIAAVGLGNPLGAENAKAAFATFNAGGLVAEETRGIAILLEGELATHPRGDAIMLPVILDGGKVAPAARESRAMRRRGAACVAPSGHAVIAMATTDSDEATALALSRVGCTRAAALDRGSHRATFLHRAGAGSPPLARYDESVLYAVSRPMAPRAFRWNVAAP